LWSGEASTGKRWPDGMTVMVGRYRFLKSQHRTKQTIITKRIRHVFSKGQPRIQTRSLNILLLSSWSKLQKENFKDARPLNLVFTFYR